MLWQWLEVYLLFKNQLQLCVAYELKVWSFLGQALLHDDIYLVINDLVLSHNIQLKASEQLYH